MISVAPAPPPHDFNERVREKGLNALAELVGELPSRRRRGKPRGKRAEAREKIHSRDFPPFWRDVLDDMLLAYSRRCAYLALYIEHGTGSPSVDHVVPKSLAWDLAYEWSNYRLCSASFNSRKGVLTTLADPFEDIDGWFGLEFSAFQVVEGPNAEKSEARIAATIEVLNLPEFCKAREEYVVNYESGGIALGYLERRAPFIAKELRRQGRLLLGDQ